VANILLIAVLLWRVETMQALTDAAGNDAEETPVAGDSIYTKLESLLQQCCVDQQYYLQHDASLNQLAKILGTNRNYLSQHFAQRGLTYNSYINGLRIEHFIRLYEQAVASGRDITARQLAAESGFNSYSTFGRAFKQVVGRSVAEWMEGKR